MTARVSPHRGGWSARIWLAMLVAIALGMTVSAARTGSVPLAVSGVGTTFLGVIAYLEPIPFRADIRSFLRERLTGQGDRDVGVLSAVALVLLFAGQALHWLL